MVCFGIIGVVGGVGGSGGGQLVGHVAGDVHDPQGLTVVISCGATVVTGLLVAFVSGVLGVGLEICGLNGL